MVKIRNKKQYKILRSFFRRNMPAPETILWQKLRGKSLGIKFRRQFSVNNYILDFYSPTLKLAIEIDGQSHFTARAKMQDQIRDKDLERLGIKVLRFRNNDVTENLEGVFAIIIQEVNKNHLPPLILPLRMGEKV